MIPGQGNPFFCTAQPLFRSPAELAVGLALKELRYGSTSSDSPLRPATVPSVPPLPSGVRTGFGIAGAAVYRPRWLLSPGRAGSSAWLFHENERDEDLRSHTSHPP